MEMEEVEEGLILNGARRINRNRPRSLIGLIPLAFGVFVPILFPGIQMLIFKYLWGFMKTPVDQNKCHCNCWDTVFKGPYEVGPSSYKHFYFNSTLTTFKIWTVTVIGVIALYESCKRLLKITLQRKLRLTMAILFLSSIFSNYYAWWGVINYYNDEFWSQWYHQLFFTVTELVTTVLILQQIDKSVLIHPQSCVIIASIALIHILLASKDQFVTNIILGKGQLHQVLRDLAFMTSDIIYFFVSVFELNNYFKINGDSFKSWFSNRKNSKFVIIVNLILLVSSFILLQ